MNLSTRQKVFLAAIILPIVVLLGWMGMLATKRMVGKSVLLEIEGYDPRDMLAGHYLRYRVRYGEAVNCATGTAEDQRRPYCVCLAKKPETRYHRGAWLGACEQKPSDCSLFLKGKCTYGGFEAGIERFYIPEAKSQMLAVVPANSHIEVRVGSDGNGIVNGMWANDIPILDLPAEASR